MTTTTARGTTTSAGTSKRAISIAVVLLIVAVGIALIVALASGGSDGESSDQTGSSRIPQGDVRQVSFAEVAGDALPRFEPTGRDPAIGMDAPSLTASYFDNSEVTVNFDDGTPRVVMFLAHWCPHCQAEVAALTDWFGVNGVPEAIEIVPISTSVDQGAPNYPPATWFLREGWPVPVLRDSAQNDLATGYGLSSFPYLVAIDGDGKVLSRSSGQLPEGQWDIIIDRLGAGSAAS